MEGASSKSWLAGWLAPSFVCILGYARRHGKRTPRSNHTEERAVLAACSERLTVGRNDQHRCQQNAAARLHGCTTHGG